MTVGQRIKNKREELNMTQDELAKRMGYVGKSAISKVENNGNNMTTDRVKLFASALNTTVEYLMGWENDQENIREGKELFNLQKDKELLEYAKKLSKLKETDRESIMKLIDSLSNEKE